MLMSFEKQKKVINVHKYKGYDLDVFYMDGFVNGIIQQTREEIQDLMVEKIFEKFTKSQP